MKTTWMLFLISMIALKTHAFERREFYNGVRQMGMGGVVVPTVNDETALISNPAALGKLREAYFTVLDPEAAANSSSQSVISKGGSSTSFLDPQELHDQLVNSPDKLLHASGHVFPSLVTTNFGIGAHGSYVVDGIYDTVGGQYRYFMQQDAAMIMGLNLRLFDGRIKIGFSGRVIDRVEADYEQVSDAFALNASGLKLSNIAAEGVGVAGDMGLILTGPWKFLPSLAAVWRDAGGTEYTANEGWTYKSEKRPKPTRQTVDVGFSVSPILGNKTRMVLAGEYRDALTYGDETDQMRRVHGGIEFNFSDFLFLRGGWHQRYYSAGVEFALPIIQIQAATWGEEIGTSTTPKEDRRYMGKIAIRF